MSARAELPDAARQAGAEAPARVDLLDSLPIAVLLLDAEDRIVYANAAAETLLGRAEALLHGRRASELFSAGGAVLEIVARVRATEAEIVARDVALGGALRGYRGDVRAAPAGERDEMVVLLLEERQAAPGRGASPQADGAARSASGLAAMLAHEIKNPLSGIRGAAQLLEKGEDSRVKQMAGLIRSEVDRIRSLLDEFEHFSDTRPVTLVPVNIHEVLDHVAAVAAAGAAAGRRIAKLYDPSLPPVLGERNRLVQIFLNLVKNAAEATEVETGEIRIKTAFQPGVRLRRGKGAPVELPIVISVTDNGRGVAPDLAEHLFDPFVTGRDGGGGLGLAMVAKLVSAHGGMVEWEEGQGGGAVFRVRLAAAEGEAGDG